MIDKLVFYFQFPFVRYALIVGVLVSLCAALLGVTLVLKRYSFLGDGLSHVAFGAMAVGTVLKLTNNTPLIMGLTILAAVIMLAADSHALLKGDAAIAMLSVSALAVGYLLMNVFSVSANVSGDVCQSLFGSVNILTLTLNDVLLCAVMSFIVIAVYVLLYNRIFAVTFDENFMRAGGMRTGIMNLIISVITAIIIVLAMDLVGSLLVTALIIFPALSSMRLVSSYKGVVVLSAAFSVIGALLGIIIALLSSTPVGATIVVVDLGIFVICAIVGGILRR